MNFNRFLNNFDRNYDGFRTHVEQITDKPMKKSKQTSIYCDSLIIIVVLHPSLSIAILITTQHIAANESRVNVSVPQIYFQNE